VGSAGAGFVVECGNKLYSFNLSLRESKLTASGTGREVEHGYHGGFSFSCPVVPICPDEPTAGGFFITPSGWLSGARNEQAIFQILEEWGRMRPGGSRPSAPSASCPLFDVSIGGMNGKAVCIDIADGRFVAVVAADERVGLVLVFSQRDKSAVALKDQVLEMLPRFEIERATGEAGLKRFLR
jgi:hypothetical protein